MKKAYLFTLGMIFISLMICSCSKDDSSNPLIGKTYYSYVNSDEYDAITFYEDNIFEYCQTDKSLTRKPLSIPSIGEFSFDRSTGKIDFKETVVERWSEDFRVQKMKLLYGEFIHQSIDVTYVPYDSSTDTWATENKTKLFYQIKDKK